MNRVQKLETKWKKLEADRYAFADHSLERREDVTGLDTLKRHAGLKEAAAVFTEEGLQIFAELFANSVEQAIKRSLGQVVEDAVEKKMAEVFQIASKKLRQVADSLQELHVSDSNTIDSNDHVDSVVSLSSINSGETNASVTSASSTGMSVSTGTDEPHNQSVEKGTKRSAVIRKQAEQVAEYLRVHGRTKVVELVRNIDTIYWSTNPWIKISQFCKVNPHIRKIKNGTFEYVANP